MSVCVCHCSVTGLLKKFAVDPSLTSTILINVEKLIQTFHISEGLPSLPPKTMCFVAMVLLKLYVHEGREQNCLCHLIFGCDVQIVSSIDRIRECDIC